MKRIAVLMVTGLLMVFLCSGISEKNAFADGTEVLGPPLSLTVKSGSGIAAAGTGMCNQPGTITFGSPDIPAGAIIAQVILYWEGQFIPSPSNLDGDNTIIINGNPVTGTMVGGGVLPDPSLVNTRTYRADITSLLTAGKIAIPGSISVSGMDFDNDGHAGDCVFPFSADNGAGILVIYDTGAAANIQIRDGSDNAFIGEPVPFDSTIAQTFNFPSLNFDRTARLVLFFSSVEGLASGAPRPSSIEITVSNSTSHTDTLSNQLSSNDGDEWDTLNLDVAVPAGANRLTVQAFSRDDLNTGALPASFMWVTASFSLQSSFEGCTPGYWKQSQHFDSWPSPYTPSSSFEAIFGRDVPGTPTLLNALNMNGGGLNALMRHSAAALLNAASSGVDYAYTTSQVISMFQAAFGPPANYDPTKNKFDAANNAGCPLN